MNAADLVPQDGLKEIQKLIEKIKAGQTVRSLKTRRNYKRPHFGSVADRHGAE